MNWREYKYWFFKTYSGQDPKGCGPTSFLYFVLIGVAVLTLIGCRSVKTAESTSERHSMSSLIERLDSMARISNQRQLDFMSHQSSFIDSMRQSEKNDSSHTVVINEKGDTVRERIVIYKEVNKEHSTEKEEKDVWKQEFYRIDSLLKVSMAKQEATDSLLREHEKVSEIQLTRWQQIKQDFGGTAILAFVILLAVFLYRAINAFKRKFSFPSHTR